MTDVKKLEELAEIMDLFNADGTLSVERVMKGKWRGNLHSVANTLFPGADGARPHAVEDSG